MRKWYPSSNQGKLLSTQSTFHALRKGGSGVLGEVKRAGGWFRGPLHLVLSLPHFFFRSTLLLYLARSREAQCLGITELLCTPL